jgi:hypothetical protein
MPRLLQNQNIDSLIQGIKTITENRCSLSETDLMILTKALTQLNELKRKKGRTYEQILQGGVVDVIVLLSKFFQNSKGSTDELQQIIRNSKPNAT